MFGVEDLVPPAPLGNNSRSTADCGYQPAAILLSSPGDPQKDFYTISTVHMFYTLKFWFSFSLENFVFPNWSFRILFTLYFCYLNWFFSGGNSSSRVSLQANGFGSFYLSRSKFRGAVRPDERPVDEMEFAVVLWDLRAATRATKPRSRTCAFNSSQAGYLEHSQ